ncbi:MAG: cobalt-precorrin-5B (C(1))-methyltransferase CbiD, partial [Candidatus Accumulibacter sp.]|nr:cobalt-precorrin-5B (C(1))-methyltransferase CbiD [Accumulibacter sp.]
MAEKTPAIRSRRGEGRRHRGARSGFTTGACAAAAARAAVLGILDGEVPKTVLCRLPNGDDVNFTVEDGHVEGAGTARAVVIKDAGDDPDVTNGARLTVDIRVVPEAAGDIVLRGGAGVGKVTLEGLGLAVGDSAINPVPRRNIRENVRAVGASLLERDGLDIAISVPGGEEMARRTLNPRLGILGGISILGTTGIV